MAKLQGYLSWYPGLTLVGERRELVVGPRVEMTMPLRWREISGIDEHNCNEDCGGLVLLGTYDDVDFSKTRVGLSDESIIGVHSCVGKLVGSGDSRFLVASVK